MGFQNKAALIAKGSLFAFLVLAILQVAYSSETRPSELASLTMKMGVSGRALVEGGYQEINLTTQRIPQQDDRQQVSCSIPLSGGKAFFGWKGGSDISFSYSCTVSTKQVGTIFSEDSPLPSQVPPELSPFLASSRRVKVDSAAKELARKIVGDSNSEFEALVKIGRWVNENVRYDSSYFGKSLPSDRVLAEKAGVCEEFATLFIALARAIGVPTRYVGGYVYGVSPDRSQGESFGPHGWAEAYFPEAGWVPFDPTFAQFGFLDASHVKLYTDVDAARAIDETHYSYVGVSPPRISWVVGEPSFEILSRGSPLYSGSVDAVEVLPERSDGGSFSLVGATIGNSLEIPIAPRVSLAYKTKNFEIDLELVEDAKVSELVIGPGERRNAFFPLRTPTISEKGVYYIFPTRVFLGNREAGPSADVEVRNSPPHTSPGEVTDGRVALYGKPGNYKIIQLATEREIGFEIPSGKTYRQVPLGGLGGWLFSTTGDLFYVNDSEFRLEVQESAYSDESVSAVVYSGDSPVSGRIGNETFSLRPKENLTVTVRDWNRTGAVKAVLSDGREISKPVRRIEKPSVSILLPENPSRGVHRNVAIITNGRITGVDFTVNQAQTSDNTLSLSCGRNEITLRVAYEDLASRPAVLFEKLSVEVTCSSSFADMIRGFFAWLFSSA